MAIAFGAALGTSNANSASPSLGSLTISGSNLALIVGISTESQAVTVSGVNWDDGAGGSAEAMTRLGNFQDVGTSSIGRLSFWYLLNPSTSNSRIIGTLSGATPWVVAATYYTGVVQSDAFTAATQATDTASPGTDSDTSDTNGSWQISLAYCPLGQPIVISSGATSRQGAPTPPGTITMRLSDSNAAFNSGAGNTITYSWSADNGGWISAMMRPSEVPAGPSTTIAGRDFMLIGT